MIERVLDKVAPSLIILELDIYFPASRHLTQATIFPHLLNLSGHMRYPFTINPPYSLLIARCSSLRRLHIGGWARPTIFFQQYITDFAPLYIGSLDDFNSYFRFH